MCFGPHPADHTAQLIPQPPDAFALIGQVEPGPSGGRGGDRRRPQGGAGSPACRDPGKPELPEPESAHPVRPASARSHCAPTTMAGYATPTAGGGVLVRVRWHQCAHRHRGGAECRGARRERRISGSAGRDADRLRPDAATGFGDRPLAGAVWPTTVPDSR